MPLPTPRTGESHSDFLSRCIPNEHVQAEASSNDQAVAICQSQWDQHKDVVSMLRDARRLVQGRVSMTRANVRKAITAAVHLKQVEKAESELARQIEQITANQIAASIKAIQGIDKIESLDATLHALPPAEKYTKQIIEESAAILARYSFEAAASVFLLFNVDPVKSKAPSTKQIDENDEDEIRQLSSAAEWLLSAGIELPPGVVTEYPEWMIKFIREQLRRQFEQDYWRKIAPTTFKHVETILRDAIERGHSIARIAKDMNARFPSEYSRQRGKLVARTEVKDALNGARKMSHDKIRADVPELNMRSEWLSVLGTTTRDEHAELHGVPEDNEGMWTLVGIRIPWPGHYSLPASQRCNCQCTIVQAFGMDDAEAEALIQDYYARVGIAA